MPITHLPQPFQPTARESAIRRSLWLMPGLLALVFVAVIARWADARDTQESTQFRQTLVADAASVEVQLGGRKDMEQAKLREAVSHLPKAANGNTDALLAAVPEVVAGMDRLWNRIVWLDADNQVVARAARLAPIPAGSSEALRIQSRGQADHFVEALPGSDGKPGGQLQARYDITDLLQSTDLGWLTQRYEVDFVSDLGEVIATTSVPAKSPEGARYERPLRAFKDTTLRLTPYDAPVSWRQSPSTLALLAGLLLLGAAASQLLRREMRRVARAVTVSQSEAAWRQSMEDSAVVGLRARNQDGRILYVNKTLCELVGYSREELVGLVPPLPFWPPDAVDDMLARNRMTLDGLAPAAGTEARWRHRDGRLIDVMVFEAPLVDSLGVRVGWMGSIVDISERKRLAESERRQSDALARHARLTIMGEMASSLAHDINQPLTTIANYTAGLLVRLSRQAAPDAEVLQALEAIGRHAKQAGDIVVRIRGRLGPRATVRRQSDINRVVSAALDLQRSRLAQEGVRLVLDLGRELPLVDLDLIGMDQVVMNLVRNAVEVLATCDHERVLRVSTGLQAGPSEGAGHVSIRVDVCDNGPGLQGRDIQSLCDPFYSTKPDGSGLGLAICRRIVEDHGGMLEVSEAPDGGARFRVVLPVRNVSEGDTP